MAQDHESDRCPRCQGPNDHGDECVQLEREAERRAEAAAEDSIGGFRD